jgi:polar amino acid transport system substrate-binding protein
LNLTPNSLKLDTLLSLIRKTIMRTQFQQRFLLCRLGATLLVMLLSVNAVNAKDAAPGLDRITKTQTLRVGMTGGQPPFSMKNRDEKLIGMDVDLAKLLSSSMGVELQIVEMPFANLLPALEDGEVDVVLSGMTATLQRNVRVPFVGPYYVTGISILTKSSLLASVQTAEKMNSGDIRTAALRGSTSEEFVERNLPESQLTATVNHADAIKLLLDGDIDVLVADGPVCALSILRHPDNGLVTLERPLTIEPIGIAITPGDPLLVNLVQNYMQALRATGALEALQNKWFNSGAWLAQLP